MKAEGSAPANLAVGQLEVGDQMRPAVPMENRMGSYSSCATGSWKEQ